MAIEKPLIAPVNMQIKSRLSLVHFLKYAVSGEIWYSTLKSQLWIKEMATRGGTERMDSTPADLFKLSWML
jgi:hypothetical protein